KDRLSLGIEAELARIEQVIHTVEAHDRPAMEHVDAVRRLPRRIALYGIIAEPALIRPHIDGRPVADRQLIHVEPHTQAAYLTWRTNETEAVLGGKICLDGSAFADREGTIVDDDLGDVAVELPSQPAVVTDHD